MAQELNIEQKLADLLDTRDFYPETLGKDGRPVDRRGPVPGSRRLRGGVGHGQGEGRRRLPIFVFVLVAGKIHVNMHLKDLVPIIG